MKFDAASDVFRPADGAPPQTLFRFFWWNLKGSFGALFLATIVSAIAGAIEIGSALVLGWVVDATLNTEPEQVFIDQFGLLMAGLAFFLLVRPIVTGLSSAMSSLIIAPNVNVQVLARLNRHTLGQAVQFFDDDFAGRIAQKQLQTARAVTDVTVESINVIAFASASFIAAIALLGNIELWVAGLMLIWAILYGITLFLFRKVIRRRSAARASARAMVTGQVVDTITNIKTVKLFAHNEFEDRSALDAMAVFRDRVVDFGWVMTNIRLILTFLSGVLPVALLGSTIWLWSNGNATPGDIAAAGAVALRIAQMTGWVSFVLMTIYAALGEAEDGMKTLSPPHSMTDRDDPVEIERATGRITFEDVTFGYGQDKGAISDLSVTVSPGEKLGIVGASGAGKSTFVALLLRLYDTEAGRILLDGVDLRDISQESLRRQIAMVTQEAAMFNRSARDNILYGRPDASDEDLIKASKRAHAHEFIEELQDFEGRRGYDAHLGERGVKLSGGQRQRIALARAFLKDAPILVLDEATSALDSELEASIQETLSDVMTGKTVIAIAHRLSTISAMDRIIVIDHGRIIEEGTHQQLLNQGGAYAKYWARQSGGFIGLPEVAE